MPHMAAFAVRLHVALGDIGRYAVHALRDRSGASCVQLVLVVSDVDRARTCVAGRGQPVTPGPPPQTTAELSGTLRAV